MNSFVIAQSYFFAAKFRHQQIHKEHGESVLASRALYVFAVMGGTPISHRRELRKRRRDRRDQVCGMMTERSGKKPEGKLTGFFILISWHIKMKWYNKYMVKIVKTALHWIILYGKLYLSIILFACLMHLCGVSARISRR